MSETLSELADRLGRLSYHDRLYCVPGDPCRASDCLTRKKEDPCQPCQVRKEVIEIASALRATEVQEPDGRVFYVDPRPFLTFIEYQDEARSAAMVVTTFPLTDDDIPLVLGASPPTAEPEKIDFKVDPDNGALSFVSIPAQGVEEPEPSHCPTCGFHRQDNGQCPFCLKAHRIAGHAPDDFPQSMVAAAQGVEEPEPCIGCGSTTVCDCVNGVSDLDSNTKMAAAQGDKADE